VSDRLVISKPAELFTHNHHKGLKEKGQRKRKYPMSDRFVGNQRSKENGETGSD